MSFDPVLLLYLNPELYLDENITSVEQAFQYYSQNSNQGLWYSLDTLPTNFEEGVFISDHKNIINISALNQTIKHANLIDGEALDDVEKIGKYMPTIYRSAYLRGRNMFQFNLPGDGQNFYITPCNINVGDWLKLVKNGSEILYGSVASIIDSTTFTLCNDRYDFTELADYLVYGIKVYDPLRLARINYLRVYSASPTPPTTNYVTVDPEFNYELYKILYPDSRLLDREAAYVDWMSKQNNQDFRIGRTRDIAGNLDLDNSIPEQLEQLRVNHYLHLNFTQPTGRLQWGDVNLYYVTTNDVRTSAMISPYFDGLITERAIKSYVDNFFNNMAPLNNVYVVGEATFTGATAFCNQTIMSTVNIEYVTGNATTYCNINNFLETTVFQSSTCNVGTVYNYNDVLSMGNNYISGSTFYTACNTVFCNDRIVFSNNAIDIYAPMCLSNTTLFAAPSTFNSTTIYNAPLTVNSTATFQSNIQVDAHANFTTAAFSNISTYGLLTSNLNTSNISTITTISCNMNTYDAKIYQAQISNLTAYSSSNAYLYSHVLKTDFLTAGAYYAYSNVSSYMVGQQGRFSNLYIDEQVTINYLEGTNMNVQQATFAYQENTGLAVFQSNVQASNMSVSNLNTELIMAHDLFSCNINVHDAVLQQASVSNLTTFSSSNTYLYSQISTADTSISETCFAFSNVSSNIIAQTGRISNLYIDEQLTVEKIEIDWMNARHAILEYQETFGLAVFQCNVDVLGTLEVDKDVLVNGFVYGPGIGIADMLTIEQGFSNAQNVVVDNLHINESLSVGGSVVIGDQYTTSNTMLKVNGAMEAVNYDVTSDLRLKENVQDLDGHQVLDRLRKITPCTYNFKHKYDASNRYGFIAQELEKVFPEMIHTIGDYKISVNRVAEPYQGALFLKNHKFEANEKLIIKVDSLLKQVIVDQVLTRDLFTLQTMDTYMYDVPILIKYVCYDEIRTIDYNQLTSVLLSSIKTLDDKIRIISNCHFQDVKMLYQ